MRLHTSAAETDVYAAARIARVGVVGMTRHGSRKADHAFEVKLEGSSKRRPNGGSSGAGSGYAATWDQWGVFLAHLFAVDPNMCCWAYNGREQFDARTCYRFDAGEWPTDAHGDHSWNGRTCRKCSARQDYSLA